MKLIRFFSLTILTSLLLLGAGTAQIDNFDDGNDNGWSHFDPISLAIGSSWVVFDASSNALNIKAAGQNLNPALGPSRGAAFQQNIYSDFWVSVDIVDWDPAQRQAIGILARIQPNPSLGDAHGYLLSYQPQENDIQITRLVGEQPAGYIGDDPELSPRPQPDEGVRLIFTGTGNTLTGRAYSISDPDVLLAESSGTDDSFTEGISGVLAFDFSPSANSPINATFDNYVAGAEEPYRFATIDARIENDNLLIDFLSKPGTFYAIDQSSDLKDWLEIDDGIEGATGSDRTTVQVPFAAGSKMFFRLRKQ
ncbi:MAG: hypothetical protein GY899_11260 [Verrucomicrobiaceae bacterium]|nr:hypothetical protein [Verrucomicrobiaceae bacterium]